MTGATGFLGTEIAGIMTDTTDRKVWGLQMQQENFCRNPKLPDNLYVADATILPKAMGNPPILTIMALAKKIARVIKTNPYLFL